MQAATTAPPRRQKPRRVIYKSSALERTAPQLVGAASAEAVSAARSIQKANAAAENVRLSFKQKRDVDLGSAVDGDDDASNAKKYERRLKMNRQSAAASRIRREAYTKALEAELVSMEQEYDAAICKLRAALERNRELEEAQQVKLADDGTAQNIKQEDEEEPEVEEVVADESHDDCDINLDHFDDDIAAVFPPHQIQQLDFNSHQSKVETLLADPCFADNADVLQFPVPDTLPDCFLHAPTDDGGVVDERDFL